ncbi:hypothetical protein GCM10011588_63180 [Nocardia jinanensis]|uniref:Uncharacterized protein n=1 Tax=Nocardia jinanensis TaxID=382504 RepID=A0A917RVH7_9NOCA|nr:hypothetical protein GCM10011588_63180 [Nocardia jinanensis]
MAPATAEALLVRIPPACQKASVSSRLDILLQPHIRIEVERRRLGAELPDLLHRQYGLDLIRGAEPAIGS